MHGDSSIQSAGICTVYGSIFKEEVQSFKSDNNIDTQ